MNEKIVDILLSLGVGLIDNDVINHIVTQGYNELLTACQVVLYLESLGYDLSYTLLAKEAKRV